MNFLQRLEMACRIFFGILSDDTLAVLLVGLSELDECFPEGIPFDPDEAQEFVAQAEIGRQLIELRDAFEQAKQESSLEGSDLSLSEQLSLGNKLNEILINSGIDIPFLPNGMAGGTPFTEALDKALKEGIQVGVNRGDDRPLRIYPVDGGFGAPS